MELVPLLQCLLKSTITNTGNYSVSLSPQDEPSLSKLESLLNYSIEEIYIIFKSKKTSFGAPTKFKYYQSLVEIGTRTDMLKKYPGLDKLVIHEEYKLPTRITKHTSNPSVYQFTIPLMSNSMSTGGIGATGPTGVISLEKNIKWVDNKEVKNYKRFLKYIDVYKGTQISM